MMAKTISNETQDEAMKVAKATQKPGQTKEQTKLIALGVEKGIAEFKKQHKSKARDRDKARKQDIKSKMRANADSDNEVIETEDKPSVQRLPWGLLIISWIGFIAWHFVG
jgi:hypothetical protein